MPEADHFNTLKTLHAGGESYRICDVSALQEQGIAETDRLPFSIRVMLESLLRNMDGRRITREHVLGLANWQPDPGEQEVPLNLARVLMQDFTGVPAVVDLAALRDGMEEFGAPPEEINPVVPTDLVIDHSVQVDYFGTSRAYELNVDKEYERNGERYRSLKWAADSLDNLRVVPPGTGIVHQVNLEYLSEVVTDREHGGERWAYPDSLVGTDSHTPMINGLGVLGWGVGGIEAEAVMLGEPYYLLAPEVVGFRVSGRLPEGATATDLVLRVTQMLRAHGVVNKFVEFYGPGLETLSVADRATIANMAPEYGATMGYFPVDAETLEYLRFTNRAERAELAEAYTRETGLFHDDSSPEPEYSSRLELDLGSVEPSVAGPKLPHHRNDLSTMQESFNEMLTAEKGAKGFGLSDDELDATVEVEYQGESFELSHGSLVIAAITSCTNTSNPSVMVGAGLIAKRAVELGLDRKPWVKTSLAPGSQVVTEYLEKAGLMPFFEALGFHVVGYGCTTCIGNSGPLPDEIREAILDGGLVAASVLSGNRNFEGRISPYTRANFLASPMLVVAYALTGRIDTDFAEEPVGHDPNGRPVYLDELWPTNEEIREEIRSSVEPKMFSEQYSDVFEGDEQWESLDAEASELYPWDEDSTYIQQPPFVRGIDADPQGWEDINGARVLGVFGDSLTTDHISPAGTIPEDSPAGQYLIEHGVEPDQFNSYGSRRGNHEVMMRGTFGNIRLNNRLVEGVEGGFTRKFPEGEVETVYDAAMQYIEEGTPLIVIGGKRYGTGSSRDWAAKGTLLLGVEAVIAESYERIHRSNLIGMGVLPLEFIPGEGRNELGLTGYETYSITGLSERGVAPGAEYSVRAVGEDGGVTEFTVRTAVDNEMEAEYLRHRGILPHVLRRMAHAGVPTEA